MTIREATCGADVRQVIEWTKALVASVQGPLQVDPAHCGAQIARLMHSPDAVVLMSKGGFIAGELTQTIISPQVIASEHGWYASDRSGLRLLIAFEKWAAPRSALIKMSTPAPGSVAGKILERRGYRAAEMAWVK